MATRECDVKINCECIETPYANLSAELAEPYVFVSPRIVIVPPPLARIFTQLGCKRWCYSSISQADADACALAQATECATVPDGPEPPIVVDPPIPPTGFPQVSVFATEPATSFGEDPGIFNLSRNGSLAQPLTVQFTLSGEAQNGVDYDTLPYFVTIDAGDSNVDVIVIPMDTGEIISKSVILTVLSGSNYTPGASSSDTVEISPEDCGTPAFRLFGYGDAMAEEIAELRPTAIDSELPEWDGIFRLRPGGISYASNADCYSISGKRIEIEVFIDQLLLETVACEVPWFVVGNGCMACNSGNEIYTYITSAYMYIGYGSDSEPFLTLNSGVSGGLGDYKYRLSPRCSGTYLGANPYLLGEDNIAHFTFGAVLLTVVDL